MSIAEKAAKLKRSAQKKIEAEEKKEPSHSTVWKLEELERHQRAHEALNYLEKTKDPLTQEVLDLMEMDEDMPSPVY